MFHFCLIGRLPLEEHQNIKILRDRLTYVFYQFGLVALNDDLSLKDCTTGKVYKALSAGPNQTVWILESEISQVKQKIKLTNV